MRSKKKIKLDTSLSIKEQAEQLLSICKEGELNKVPLSISNNTIIMVPKNLTEAQRESKRQRWQGICK